MGAQQLTEMTCDSFWQQVNDTWAAYYNVDSSSMLQAGTTLVPFPSYDDPRVVLYAFEKHTFAQVAPPLVERTRAVIDANPNANLTVDHLLQVWGVPANRLPDSVVFHLCPSEFVPVPLPAGFTVRALTPQDAPALAVLHAATPADEIEEAEIELDHDDVTGIFADDLLVAIGSTYAFRGFTDPGILTRPDYRRRGLGKALISHMASAVLARGGSPMYRAAGDNIASVRIAAALGYRQWASVSGFTQT